MLNKMKLISAVFLEQELFQHFLTELTLRGHDLYLASGQICHKSRDIYYKTR